MVEKMKSRKFILTVVTALLTIANDGFGLGLPTTSILTITSLVTAYVLGQGYVDGQAAKG